MPQKHLVYFRKSFRNVLIYGIGTKVNLVVRRKVRGLFHNSETELKFEMVFDFVSDPFRFRELRLLV